MRLFLRISVMRIVVLNCEKMLVFESKAFMKLIYVKSGLFSGYFYKAASPMLFSAFGVYTDRQLA